MRLKAQKNPMKRFFKVRLYETFEALINFYRLDLNHRLLSYVIVPFLLGFIGYIIDSLLPITVEITLYEFMNDYINISLTVISLFLTLSIGYLSLLIGGNNKGLERIKCTYSKKYKLKGEQVLLYDIIYIEIYVLIFTELNMIIFLFLSKFMILISTIHISKLILYVSIILFSNIILMMFRNVKNVYFILFD